MRNLTMNMMINYFKITQTNANFRFNFLVKNFKLFLFFVLLMVFSSLRNTFAQTGVTEKEVNLEEITVSAQRTKVTYADISRVVSVITKKDIERSGVQSVNELLEFALGVDVRQRGQHGIQADISMRGGSFDQVLILLNGVNVSDPQTGHFSLNLPISLDAIERVEIVAGSTSRIYGPNAFTGAVNLITGSNEENTSVIKFEVGENGLINTNITTTIQGEKSRHLLSLGYKKSDGYINNSDYKMLNTFYQGKWRSEKVDYNLQLGRTVRKFGANTFYTPKYPNQYEETKTNFISAKASVKGKIKFTPTIYYRWQTDHFELYRDKKNAPNWYQKHNNHSTNIYGLNLNASWAWRLGKTAIGSELRSENILSNVLGESRSEKKVWGRDNAYYDKEDSRNNLSLFFEHTKSFWQDRFTTTAGVMANYNDFFNDKISWFPGIDMSLKLCKDMKIYATANKALRLPTFTDLYYNSPTHKGNTNLKPEEATSYEGGIKLSKKGIVSHIAYFFRAGKNLIDWTKKNTTDIKWEARNLTDVDFKGVETSIQLRPFIWNQKFKFIKSVSIKYSYTDVSNIRSKNISAYVLDNLKHKFDGELTLNIFKNIFFSSLISWQDRAGTFGYYASPTAQVVEKDYEPFWLVNARIAWKRKIYEAYLQITNIFDKKYYDIGNVIQPGRWISAGVKININW